MRVTVAICTWNRAALLDRTLTSLHGLHLPPGLDWDVVVVNNNCTDDTDEVIARHRTALPVRRVFEATPGLSHARNRALVESTGELLVWTDDDVEVDPCWLARFVEAADRWPDAAFFGGPIEPKFLASPAPWLTRHLDRIAVVFGAIDFGPCMRRLVGDELPFGGCMAVRRAALTGHWFDAVLGVQAGRRINGEESSLLRALVAEGHFGVWVPGARVRHLVPPERMTLRHVWTWYLGSGRASVRAGWIPPSPRVFGVPRWMIRRYAASRFSAWWWSPIKNRPWLVAFRDAAMLAGMIDEARKAA